MSNKKTAKKPFLETQRARDFQKAHETQKRVGLYEVGKPNLVDMLWDTQLNTREKRRVEKAMEAEFKKAALRRLKKAGVSERDAKRMLKALRDMRFPQAEDISIKYSLYLSTITQKMQKKKKPAPCKCQK